MGVVVTLMLVAFVIMLILRLKYKTSKSHQQQQMRRVSTTSNGGGGSKRPKEAADPDEEEYFCLRPTGTASKPNVVATATARNHKINGSLQRPTNQDHTNPDLIPGTIVGGGLPHHVNIHGPGILQTKNAAALQRLNLNIIFI